MEGWMDGWREKQEVREVFRGLEAGNKTAAAEGVNTNTHRGLDEDRSACVLI